MSETEQQIRAILREHAADSEHLLEDVKAEWVGEHSFADERDRLRKELAATHDAWNSMREKWAAAERRAESAERSLSALREAVGPFVAVARVYAKFSPPLSTRNGTGAKVLRIEHGAHEASLEVNDFERLLAAHDAAPVPQSEPPTLTLEEVESVLRDQHWLNDCIVQVVKRLKKILAQKGAGRGR